VARIRQIKPEFFKNEDVGGLEWPARMLFVGLWTIAAADGRLLDRPRRIAAELFPYDRMDDQIDMLLGMLAARGLIVRYVADGKPCIQIINFAKHQKPHIKEPGSGLPAPSDNVGQSPGFPVLAQALPDENLTSRSGSLGSGSLGSGESAPRAPARDLWPAWRWFERFKVLWPEAHRKLAYGSGDDDAKATGELEDKLNSLPGEARLDAQESADKLIVDYFAIGACRPAGHPWKWFVQRFNELRIGPVARGSPPARGNKPDHKATIQTVKDWVGGT
jgi:hypothetical protein